MTTLSEEQAFSQIIAELQDSLSLLRSRNVELSVEPIAVIDENAATRTAEIRIFAYHRTNLIAVLEEFLCFKGRCRLTEADVRMLTKEFVAACIQKLDGDLDSR